jgi:hypothetical protein
MHFDAAKEMGLDNMVFDLGFTRVSDSDIDGLFTPRDNDGGGSEDSAPGGFGMGGNALEFSVILNYSPSDYAKVKAAFDEIGGSPEEIVYGLLGLTAEE